MRRPDSTRWNQTAHVDPTDKVRLRGFIRNETTYYNAVLKGFASLLRTMPEVFTSVSDELFSIVAEKGFDIRKAKANLSALPVELVPFKDEIETLSDRTLLMLDTVSVATVLHPHVRRNIAIEMRKYHIGNHDALVRNSNKKDDSGTPVELLHMIVDNTKRHFQLPMSAVFISEDRKSFRTAYNAQPIVLDKPIPTELTWNLMILRDDDARNGTWYAEFRKEDDVYMLKFFDPAIRHKGSHKLAADKHLKMRTYFER